MGLWTTSHKIMKELIAKVKDISDSKAINMIKLNKSEIYIYLRGNNDGTVDVTPTIRLKNLPPERAERFIRALEEMGIALELGPHQDTR